MRVKTFCGGEMGENCYFAEDEITGFSAVIDPGFPLSLSSEELKRVKAIFLTHGHFDHIFYASALREKTGAPIYIHEKDSEFLQNEALNLGYVSFSGCPPFEADCLLSDGQMVRVGDLSFRTIHTPGHTRGSCCYFCENALFSGDTLMQGTIGRVDFPTGSWSEMEASLRRFSEFSDEVILYPGHGASSTISYERAYNNYLRGC